MSEQFEMAYLPDYQGDKREVIQSNINAPVGVDSIYIAVQSDVDLYRQVEIMNTWRDLWDFIRDYNEMRQVGALYAMRDINKPQSYTRVAQDITGVTTTDLLIGIGANVNNSALPTGEEMAVNMLETSFKQLREFANENFLKAL